VPEIGLPSVREIFVKGYRMIYEIQGSEVTILAFIHGARRLPGV
jgi:plasmid stabilization system protein ParE